MNVNATVVGTCSLCRQRTTIYSRFDPKKRVCVNRKACRDRLVIQNRSTAEFEIAHLDAYETTLR